MKNMMEEEVIYYETGITNSGNIERFSTKRAAIARAKSLAKKHKEDVWVDARTEEDPVASYRVSARGIESII